METSKNFRKRYFRPKIFKYWVLLDKKGEKYSNNEKAILMISFLIEFWQFMRERKKYWLLPIVIILGLFGILIVLTQGTAVAPFIYTIF